MNCADCYWGKSNNALNSEKICCNEKSPNYNQVFSTENAEKNGCKYAETGQAVDYRNMTAWEFALKYYM